jgi:hypothetical protein
MLLRVFKLESVFYVRTHLDSESNKYFIQSSLSIGLDLLQLSVCTVRFAVEEDQVTGDLVLFLGWPEAKQAKPRGARTVILPKLASQRRHCPTWRQNAENLMPTVFILFQKKTSPQAIMFI